MKDRHKVKSFAEVQQLFTVEYGKSVETCLEMKRAKELTVLGDSVCQVRVKGSAVGSGFLLFDRFILTNGHVIKESLPLPPQGGICIIGHPGQGVKKIDPCCIISLADRKAAKTKHCKENKEYMHIMIESFQDKWALQRLQDRHKLTYDSCFYHGSSGSPVFDEYCNVIAMHSGGYTYETPKGKTQSIIEYALPLSLTLETIIHQAVVSQRVDVIKSFLTGMNSQCQQILDRLKGQIHQGKPEEYFVYIEEEFCTFYDLLFNRVEPMDME
ncbi:LOW QUALITY PROTEIN: uncharacterized protein FYW47_018397 [Aplochiton taeniatus]